jgi:hypothetical protein
MKQDPEWVERKKENLRRHREKGWKNNARYKRALDLKKEFVEIKGGKCEKCGYNRNLAALDFHHTDPDSKKIRINMNEMAKVNKEELLRKELEQCDLLCSNCHREEHHPTMVI